MNKKTKVRRGCLLCLAFVRNYAFYMAAYNHDGSLIVGGTRSLSNQYWNTTHGNYIDIAILEWCKLFGNYNQEQFHWKRTIKDKARYKGQLLTMVGKSESEWAEYHDSIVKYRDEFVAHLDENNDYIVPNLEMALKLVINHYDYLLNNETEEGFFPESVPNIHTYYQKHFEMARGVYAGCAAEFE